MEGVFEVGVYGLTLQSVFLDIRLLKFVQYSVAPQKRLGVGNYAIALLFPVRLVLNEFEQSARMRSFVLLNNRLIKFV